MYDKISCYGCARYQPSLGGYPVVNIVNSIGGGFRAYSGLLPAAPGAGDSNVRASVRVFHIPAANAVAMFRGDIAIIPDSDDVVASLGAGDLPANISAP